MGLGTYFAIARMQIQHDLMYRLDLLISLLVVPTIIGVNFFVWGAVFSTQQTIAGFTFDGMMQYIILGQLISIAIYNTAALMLQQLVQSGDLTRALLLKPANPLGNLLALALGNRAVAFVIEIIPLAIIAALIFGFTLPGGFTLILFAISILLAFLLNFFVSLIIGLLAFWTVRVEAFQWLTWMVVRVLSGEFFPLTLFPQKLQTLSMFLPFEYLRFRVALIAVNGDLSSALLTILGQLVWIVVIGAIAGFMWMRVVRGYTQAGG